MWGVALWEGGGTLNKTLLCGGKQPAIAFGLGWLTVFLFSLHPSRWVPWSGLSKPAEPAVSAGLEGHCSPGWERAAGKEERLWQHREPMGLPRSIKPQPKRERLPIVNVRFLSLAPFRYSIWKKILSGALQKSKPLLRFAVSLVAGKATVKHSPYAQPQR